MEPLRIISLGVGVQSVALYYMSSMGELPRADYAVFSDPGSEREKTYEYLEFLQQWQKQNNGIPIIVRKDKNLYEDLLKAQNSKGNRFASIPAFTQNESTGKEGMLRRQCTFEYKIEVVNKAIRDLHGLKPRQRNKPSEIWLGITIDEMERAAIPSSNWQTYIYPYLGYKTSKSDKAKLLPDELTYKATRNDLYHWYKRHNLPIPIKSGCTFCPYKLNSDWKDMKENTPNDFKEAIEVDESIRNSSNRGVKQPVFLHRSCTPLKEVNLDEGVNFEIECSGFCHI